VKFTVSVLAWHCIGLLFVPYVLWGCTVNPYTKRSQLVLTSPSYEGWLGTAAYRNILNDPSITLDQDPLTLIAIRRVAARLIAAAEQSPYADMARSFDWEIAVVDDDEIRNAVALPGGKIVIYTGLFPIARHEAGLAAALAHEMVHALARHSAEQLTYDALRTTAHPEALLPFSRRHELEADYIGLLLTASAGYDPRESVRMWQRMKESGEESSPEHLSTHPSYATRIAALQINLSEAWRIYERGPAEAAAGSGVKHPSPAATW
jgi:metalloendopeptidase OMA1, mitochondrial